MQPFSGFPSADKIECKRERFRDACLRQSPVKELSLLRDAISEGGCSNVQSHCINNAFPPEVQKETSTKNKRHK